MAYENVISNKKYTKWNKSKSHWSTEEIYEL